MSVALTTEQVRAQQKTVTRRAGWQVLRPGDLVTLCPKVRGRRAGEALERIVTVEIVSTRRERLDAITADDVVAEGFPGMTPPEFVAFFIASHRGVSASSEITRIEWAYPRVCRACGCTDFAACETLTGPCSWRTVYDDGTGICSGCPGSGDRWDAAR
ncbi:hypothetical protein [Tsukamurella hominis]|uniref:hypothetical protein n=1 Tax=Tsukamurella hominis TaxID=1970232 RepID=UPI0039EB6866